MINKLIRFIKIHGVKELVKKAILLPVYKIKRAVLKKKHAQQLEQLLTLNKDKELIIFYSPVSWSLPLYQRPHHIALQLAKLGYVYFYCTNNPIRDNVNGFKEIATNCYLTDQKDLLLNLSRQKTIHLYSTDMRDIGWLHKKAKNNHDIVLYEYIDEIHQDITGEIPNFVIKNHDSLLKDEVNCVVVASADKLLQDVADKRSKNYHLVTNGVDVSHFKQTFHNQAPDILKPLIEKNKPIIGYFGAFASWFDYELVKKFARERPNYEVLLIGWDYDKSISKYKLDVEPNISIIGPIDYNDLPSYAQYFDVSMIPFLINDVTESTSPVKLFEYMALGKPIVTTSMKECKKYKSVLIAQNDKDFICKVDEALQLRGQEAYLKLLQEEAQENEWSKKASAIAEGLNMRKNGGIMTLAGRFNQIDAVKGIGMLLVIIGHMDVTLIGGSISTFICNFHMKLFFIVFG